MSKTPGPVLVIDDDAAVRNSLKFALELEGLDVRLYEGGEGILADADLPSNGCLVVDYFMPRMWKWQGSSHSGEERRNASKHDQESRA